MFIIGGAPALLAFLMTRLLPESPRWLIGKGRLNEAETIIARIEAASEHATQPGDMAAGQPDTSSPPVIPQSSKPVAPAASRPSLELFSRFYLGRTLVIWALWFCSAFTVYGLVSWLPTIYTSVFHVPVKVALLYSLVANIAGLIGTVFCALLIDWSGRRTWFAGAFGFAAIALALLALNAVDSKSVVILASVSYFFLNTTSLALYVYTPECYPTRCRAFGTSVGTAWQRVAAVIGPVAVGALMANQQIKYAFGLYCLVSIIGLLVSFAITETANKTLEDISP